MYETSLEVVIDHDLSHKNGTDIALSLNGMDGS
jgi:hypothetical protein